MFCAGLLYHLARPWRLIERLPALTSRFVFLDTHFTVRCFRDMPEFPKGPRAFILAERTSAG